MITTLREKQEVVLYQNLYDISEEDKTKVGEYLETQYKAESSNYPFEPVLYNKDAAIWSAMVVYITAQLILYRQDKTFELEGLFPVDNFDCNESSILSVDLCLRFIPDMLQELKLIDREDELVYIIEKKLYKWHFSGVNYSIDTEKLNFEPVFKNKCLKQLYINRIIEYKNKNLAKHPVFYSGISASLGLYRKEYWNEFNTINIDEEER